MDDVETVAIGPDEIVREIECPADAARDIGGECLGHRLPNLAMPIDDVAQRWTGYELHRDEVIAADLAQLIDLDDVAVEQVRRKLRFVDEELEELWALREMGMDDLQRDSLGESGRTELLRLIHGRHATFRDLVDELEGAVIVEMAVRIDHPGGEWSVALGARQMEPERAACITATSGRSFSNGSGDQGHHDHRRGAHRTLRSFLRWHARDDGADHRRASRGRRPARGAVSREVHLRRCRLTAGARQGSGEIARRAGGSLPAANPSHTTSDRPRAGRKRVRRRHGSRSLSDAIDHRRRGHRGLLTAPLAAAMRRAMVRPRDL